MRQLSIVLAIVFTLGGVRASAQPQTQPLLQSGDLVYLGSFAVPGTAGTGTYGTLAWGGAPLGLSARGLYIGCHDQGGLIAEISIPPVGGTATVLQPCVGIPNRVTQIAGDAKLGGALLYNGRAIISAYSYYDASGAVKRSHTAIMNGSLTGAALDWAQVGGLGGGWVGGYMATIPQEWQELFGGPAFTGQASISIISRTSSGPSLSVFNPDDLGRLSPVPATLVLGYPLSHPLETTSGGKANPIYQRLDSIGGVAFPAGTRSVLFISRHGRGPFCYGEAAECGGDPVQVYKGDHAYPYGFQITAYDANDLLKVKRGQIQSWEVKPYAVWPLPDIDPSGSRAALLPGGATYDPVARRIYIAPRWGGSERRIHLYEVRTPVVTPPPPPPPVEPQPPPAKPPLPVCTQSTSADGSTITITCTARPPQD